MLHLNGKPSKLSGILILIIIIILYLFFKAGKRIKLRICSWNIQWFGFPRKKEMFASVDMPLFYKMIDNMYDIKYYMNIINPDIICFQEVASISTIETLSEYLNVYDLYYQPDLVKPDQQYNVFLVKKIIPVVRFVVLDDIHKIIRLDYSYNGETVSLYNVHLKSNHGGDYSHFRTKQTKFLQDYIIQNYNPNIIIAGDTNADPGSNELRILEDNYINVIFSRKCSLKIEKKNSLWYDKNFDDHISSDELYLLDYYLVSKNVYNTIDQMLIYNILYQKLFDGDDVINKISDHYPLILDLN